jgi:serine/threonine protein kinase
LFEALEEENARNIPSNDLLGEKAMSKLKNLRFETMSAVYTPHNVRGEGGAGVVYEVTDEESNRFALKLLSVAVVSTEKTKRFRNEINFLQKNRHANIVPVLDFGFSQTEGGVKSPFYVMPLYDTTLRNIMAEGIIHDLVLPYFTQILNGVEALHLKNGWHRDLKPENILYAKEDDRLVIADFGVAHFARDEMLTSIDTKSASRMANFEYAAPEQRRKGRAVDYRADIYALGLILNEMFTGEVLQGTRHRTIEAVVADYGYLDVLVELMVRQSVDERPKSIEAIKLDLIAHKNEFTQRQHLSQLEREVVPVSDIDDPLIARPVEVVDCDYDHGTLIFHLNHEVTSEWIEVFRNIKNYSFQSESEPRYFRFRDKTASVAGSVGADKIAANFRDYLRKANTDYKEWKERTVREREERMRTELQEKINREKKQLAEREAILRSIKKELAP